MIICLFWFWILYSYYILLSFKFISIVMEPMIAVTRWTLNYYSILHLHCLRTCALILLILSNWRHWSTWYTQLLLFTPCWRNWASNMTRGIMVTHFRRRINRYLWKNIGSCPLVDCLSLIFIFFGSLIQIYTHLTPTILYRIHAS